MGGELCPRSQQGRLPSDGSEIANPHSSLRRHEQPARCISGFIEGNLDGCQPNYAIQKQNQAIIVWLICRVAICARGQSLLGAHATSTQLQWPMDSHRASQGHSMGPAQVHISSLPTAELLYWPIEDRARDSLCNRKYTTYGMPPSPIPKLMP